MIALYTTEVIATGGRDGEVRSLDGKLKLDLGVPSALYGIDDARSNPEQLFAAAYAACYLNSLKYVADEFTKVQLDTAEVRVVIRLGARTDNEGFDLELDVHLQAPDVEPKLLDELMMKADVVCPYSYATRDNIKVSFYSDAS